MRRNALIQRLKTEPLPAFSIAQHFISAHYSLVSTLKSELHQITYKALPYQSSPNPNDSQGS